MRITPLTTKRVEHSGIKVQLIGQIELASERGTPHDFVSLGEQACSEAASNGPACGGDTSACDAVPAAYQGRAACTRIGRHKQTRLVRACLPAVRSA